MASDLQTASRVNLASGNMVGSSALLPSPTPTSGTFHFRLAVPPPRQAHLRSHSGHNAGVALARAPTTPECTVSPLLFRVLLLERLQLPLPIAEAACEGCGDPVDSLGRHRAACPRTPPSRMPLNRSPQIKKRATPTERMVARIFREAGAQVRYNAYLRDMNIGVSSVDERRADVLAQDLPCFGGAQLAVDVTLVRCAAQANHNRMVRKWTVPRWSEHGTSKKRDLPRVGRTSERYLLVVLAIETGGRWSEEAVHMIRQLVIARARSVPRYTTRQVSWAWERRWTSMLATTCAVAFAAPWWSRPSGATLGATQAA